MGINRRSYRKLSGKPFHATAPAHVALGFFFLNSEKRTPRTKSGGGDGALIGHQLCKTGKNHPETEECCHEAQRTEPA